MAKKNKGLNSASRTSSTGMVRSSDAVPGEGRLITPRQFALELIRAARNDPGTENKCMLFYLVDGRELRFVRVRSEARVMVMELDERTTLSDLADKPNSNTKKSE